MMQAIQNPFEGGARTVNAVEALLLLLGLLLTLAVWIPPIASSFGLSRFGYQPIGNASDIAPDGRDAVYDDVHRQLVELGFEPLGVLRETIFLCGPHWLWRCDQRLFGSRKEHTYATVFRYVPWEAVRMGFTSGFPGDVIVWSSNTGVEPEQMEGQFNQTLDTYKLGDLLALHRHVVERLIAEGLAPHDATDLVSCGEILQMTQRRNHQQGVTSGMGKMFLVVYGGVVAVVSGAFWVYGQPLGAAMMMAGILIGSGLVCASLVHLLRGWLFCSGISRASQRRRELAAGPLD